MAGEDGEKLKNYASFRQAGDELQRMSRTGPDLLGYYRDRKDLFKRLAMATEELNGHRCSDLMGIIGIVTGTGLRNGEPAWIGYQENMPEREWWSYDPELAK